MIRTFAYELMYQTLVGIVYQNERMIDLGRHLINYGLRVKIDLKRHLILIS